jgi:hypothetical protein
MIKDKIQEAYEKMINEKTKFKYMDKANDYMSDFLEEVQDNIPITPEGKKLMKQFHKIHNDWQIVWDNILALIKES